MFAIPYVLLGLGVMQLLLLKKKQIQEAKLKHIISWEQQQPAHVPMRMIITQRFLYKIGVLKQQCKHHGTVILKRDLA